MASRASLARTISRSMSSVGSARTRAAVAGSRVDTTTYTDTGGSGLDSTTLSSTMEEASAKAVATFREALRDIPSMRANFSIIESEQTVRKCIRELFDKHADVEDPKVVDMLVFKARQELREIREQWKSRHHVYGYIQRFTEMILRDELKKRIGDGDTDKEDMLRGWRDRGLVPQTVLSWGQYERWKEEEEVKFKTFAEENKVFSKEVLERNAAASQSCTIM